MNNRIHNVSIRNFKSLKEVDFKASRVNVFIGCTDPDACNYIATATTDDGTCDYGCLCAMDYNNDGMVNFADLVQFFGFYGCTSECQGDVNGDGATDAADFMLFLANYGTFCD